MDANDISGLWRILTKSLGALFPIRLAIGASLGTAAKIAIHTTSYSLPHSLTLGALDQFDAVWYLVVFVPLVFISVIFRKRGAPEDAIHEINTLEAVLNRREFTASQRTQYWKEVADTYVARMKVQQIPTVPSSERK